MARRELSSFAILWERHENLYLKIFEDALLKLADTTSTIGDEDAISESLCPIINKICYSLSMSRNVEIRVPCWEPPIPPKSNVELKGGKVRKRPDFTCNCCNSYAENAEEFEIPFHVECKKLGKPTSPQWILTKNYVTNGIVRFDSDTHEYGKRADSGLMIGYIVDMNPNSVETEVNQYQTEYKLVYPPIGFQMNRSSLTLKTVQPILRTYVAPHSFRLFHLWVDIRQNYTK